MLILYLIIHDDNDDEEWIRPNRNLSVKNEFVLLKCIIILYMRYILTFGYLLKLIHILMFHSGKISQ